MAQIGNTTAISKLLKEQYEGPIREQINLEALIYRLFSEGPHSWAGDKVIIPLHTQGVEATSIAYKPESAGAPGAYEEMPQATSQSYLDLSVGAKHLYASFEVTGQAEARAPGNAGGSEASFVGAMYSEMRGLEKDVRSSMNKDMFAGQGFVGFLIDNQGAAAKVGRRVSGANHLKNGDFVRCWHVPADPASNWVALTDGTANADKERFAVSAVNITDGTCTLTSNPAAGNAGPEAGLVAATDLVVFEKITSYASDARPSTNEINGINCLAFGVASNDCYGNVRTATTNTVLRGYGFKNNHAAAAAGGMSTGQPLTLSDMQLVVDSIAERTEEDVDCVIMHRFTRAQFRNLAQENIRYLPGETVGDLGHRPGDLAFEDIPITVSKDVPYGVIYFLVKDTINTYTLRPGGFQEFTDNGDIIAQKRVNDMLVDVREGFWKQYYNLVSELPRAIGVMAGISYKRG